MGTFETLFFKILQGSSDANIPFTRMCQLLKKLGFAERIRGDHHIFSKDGVEEIINVQARGSKAKPYQVKQVRNLILKHKMRLGEAKR